MNTARRAARSAGFGLLLMALFGFLAFFLTIQRVVVPGEAAETVARIAAAEAMFRVGIGSFIVVVLLDVLVAVALFLLLEPVSRGLSLLAATLRLVYAAILGAALSHLMHVLRLLDGPAAGTESPAMHAQISLALQAFEDAWQVGLAIFGVHLLVVGSLFLAARLIPRVVSLLVMLAGCGYLVDGLGTVLVPGYDFSAAMYAFVGEVLLIFWLLFGRPWAAPTPGTPPHPLPGKGP